MSGPERTQAAPDPGDDSSGCCRIIAAAGDQPSASPAIRSGLSLANSAFKAYERRDAGPRGSTSSPHCAADAAKPITAERADNQNSFIPTSDRLI